MACTFLLKSWFFVQKSEKALPDVVFLSVGLGIFPGKENIRGEPQSISELVIGFGQRELKFRN